MRMRPLFFALFVVAVLSAASPDKSSFTSSVWHGNANYDGVGKFSDCTMTAQYKTGVLLGFGKDFDWLVLAPTRDVASNWKPACVLLCRSTRTSRYAIAPHRWSKSPPR